MLLSLPRNKEIPVENSISSLMDIHQLNKIKDLSIATSIGQMTLKSKKHHFKTLFTLSHYF